ncbi:MAG: glycosylase [Candidatus Eremiobacteraeota bacterium]|nr:glycosylase [Candidatus Eremiobacteraeota bacterium]
MTFRWEKRGRIFAPSGEYPWMQSHAQNPSVLVLEDRLRVFFNARSIKDAEGKVAAYPSYVDLRRDDPAAVIAVADAPVLKLGDPGTFDQFGAMASSVLHHNGEVWLYYVGWARCEGVPYHHAVGLARSRDGGTHFERYGRGPVLTRTPSEPFIQNSPSVVKIGSRFHMWYSTGSAWIPQGDSIESIYTIAHATSVDGIEWSRDGVPLLDAAVEFECQTSPSVLRLGDRYHMWFCYRCGVDFRNARRGYRIGYAWSDDLIHWHRDDDAGRLDPSPDGWDSEMVCYPCVVDVDGRTLLFYSGNYFGRDGFGFAELYVN